MNVAPSVYSSTENEKEKMTSKKRNNPGFLPFWSGSVSRAEAEQAVVKAVIPTGYNGCFIIRTSSASPNPELSFALTVLKNGLVAHYLVNNVKPGWQVAESPEDKSVHRDLLSLFTTSPLLVGCFAVSSDGAATSQPSPQQVPNQPPSVTPEPARPRWNSKGSAQQQPQQQFAPPQGPPPQQFSPPSGRPPSGYQPQQGGNAQQPQQQQQQPQQGGNAQQQQGGAAQQQQGGAAQPQGGAQPTTGKKIGEKFNQFTDKVHVLNDKIANKIREVVDKARGQPNAQQQQQQRLSAQPQEQPQDQSNQQQDYNQQQQQNYNQQQQY